MGSGTGAATICQHTSRNGLNFTRKATARPAAQLLSAFWSFWCPGALVRNAVADEIGAHLFGTGRRFDCRDGGEAKTDHGSEKGGKRNRGLHFIGCSLRKVDHSMRWRVDIHGLETRKYCRDEETGTGHCA